MGDLVPLPRSLAADVVTGRPGDTEPAIGVGPWTPLSLVVIPLATTSDQADVDQPAQPDEGAVGDAPKRRCANIQP